MYTSMKITSNLLDKYFEANKHTNEHSFLIEKIEEEDAFKNCRDKKIKTLRIKSDRGTKETTFNSKHLAMFEPLREHLEKLDLECSWNCDFNFLKELTNLKILILYNSVFLNDAQPVFKQANNHLTFLYLNDCKLKISDKTMFNDLKCLTYLDISGVELDDQVLPGLFQELKQLHILTMKGTKFKPTEDAFIHLENLKELHFVAIDIPNECSNIFLPLKSLERLEMGSTRTFNYEAFRQLKNLRNLKLSQYSTIEIDANFFDQHPNLESLDLSRLNLHDNKSESKTNWIDLRALANLKSLKFLVLCDNKLKLDQDYEIFSLENLLHLDLSLISYKRFMKGDIKLNETTFKRMKNLKFLNLSGNRIKLEGNCFKHLIQLRELDLSDTILESDNNEDYEILSSLKQLEKFKFHGTDTSSTFKLYSLSELVNLSTLTLKITEHDLEQFREMLRIKRRRTGEAEEQPNPNPTYDDLCYFILRDMTKLIVLDIDECHLTYINKQTIGQLKDLFYLSLSRNDIRHIPDDTFDRLTNLDYINLDGNPLHKLKPNRLFLKLDKLKTVTFSNAPLVDLMDEQLNFKSLVSIESRSIRHLEKFYHSRRIYLQQKQTKAVSVSFSAFESDMKSVEQMFQTIDSKLNEIKSEKESLIEQQVKPLVDQIKLDPIEDMLNQVRQEMINKLKVIHDKSINKMNALIKKFKQPNHWTTKSIQEESMKEATQSAEKILLSQAKLPTDSYSVLPTLSTFLKLTYSKIFKGVKLVKYAELMPDLLKEIHSNNNQKKSMIIPINRAKFLFINEPHNLFNRNNNDVNSSDKCSFEIHDLYTGFFSSKRFDDNPSDISSVNSIIDTFSIVNKHLVTVRIYKVNAKCDSKKFLSKFKPERLEQDCLIECNVDSTGSVTGILLIDVFDIYLNKISQATIKYSKPNEAFVYTFGSNGILIQSRSKIDKNVSHSFALYSLKMRLKRERIRVDFKRDDLESIEFKPIKFDDEKCYIYKNNELEYFRSIMIYSFKDSSLLQQIKISVPPDNCLYKTMAIDAENNNLYFTSAISQTINCFNFQTKELVKSHIGRGTTFNKLNLAANDEKIILTNTTQNLVFNLVDNFLYSFNLD